MKKRNPSIYRKTIAKTAPLIVAIAMVFPPAIWPAQPPTVNPVQTSSQALEILFIGNSLTYFHEMPDLLAQLAKSKEEIGAILAPVGPAWDKVCKAMPKAGLYEDSIHPSKNGACLTACVFYSTIYRESPVGALYRFVLRDGKTIDYGSNPEMALLFAKTAWETTKATSIPVYGWKDGRAPCRLVLPAKDESASRLARSTINGYLGESFRVELPVANNLTRPGTYIVAGSPANNPELAALVQAGLRLTTQDLGEEGFQLITHEAQGSRYVIIYGTTPRALKHGCQELVFYRLVGTMAGGTFDWPLNMVMKPEFPYRGVYILPCWSASDSFESWERVLRFNSELTLNRNWFWLDGFPVAGHTGEYAGTALANGQNVQRLLDLAASEDMKILIGGGWFNWHHEKAIGKDRQKGILYYLDYLGAFTNFHGFYLEPTGEGSEIKNWQAESDALLMLLQAVWQRRPEFEFALAIGKFNNPEYQQRLAGLDPKRVFWWWCWGDPIRDGALARHPSVLRWHVITRMSDYHGAMDPPGPRERALSGVVTSYDPGQGFGNPWNGWGKLGANTPRNFHPHTIPYFAHQYYYRERCWNLKLDEPGFVARLRRRLFDADLPQDAGWHYWRLSQMAMAVNQKQPLRAAELADIRTFLDSTRARTWTPRTADTLARMNEAVAQLAKLAEANK